jgi:hypothetical protein
MPCGHPRHRLHIPTNKCEACANEAALVTPNSNPGSRAAIAKGCICCHNDNRAGAGIPTTGGQNGFWIRTDCPLHGTPATLPGYGEACDDRR